MARFRVFIAPTVGGKFTPQTLPCGKIVEHTTPFAAEWTARNIYGQGLCREWKVVNYTTGEEVCRYPEKPTFYQG